VEISHCRALGFAGSILLAVGSMGCGARSGADPFGDWPVIRELRATPLVAVALACAGLTLLVTAWLRLRPPTGLRRPPTGLRPRQVVTTFAWWAAPLALAPPLFSRDVYSYLAQGAMVLRGINPYHHGPAMLGGPLGWDIPPIWQFTPAPYGPVFIGAATTVMRLVGEHTVPGVLGMRAVALAGPLLIARYGPDLARRVGVDPGAALWLGLLNPLVLVHFVGGAHNDALMVGLTVLGFALAGSGRKNLGIVAVALALLVKAPALLGLVFLVPLLAASPRSWTPGDAIRPLRVQDLARQGVRVVAVTAVTVVTVTVVAGLGYGWLSALNTPTRAGHNGLSVSTDVGLLLGYPMRWLGIATLDGVVGACRTVGLAAALVAIAVALARSRRLGPLYALGLALTALAVLSPVLHPWYLLWGFVPLALTAPDGRVRRLVVAASAAGVFVLMPDGDRRPTEMLAGAAGVAVALGLLRLLRLRRPSRDVPSRDVPSRDVVQREPVPVDAEAADASGGDRGHDRVVPELLPGVNVGDVHLN
jgi:hypothetical protein